MPDSTTAARPAEAPPSATFMISRLAYITVLMTLLVVVMMVGVSLWYLFALAIPLLQIWWIHRVHTEADAEGMTAVRLLGSDHVPWDDVSGLSFPRWRAPRAVLINGSAVPLPAVGFADLPVLSSISGGRVPDPFAAAREAARAETAAESDTVDEA